MCPELRWVQNDVSTWILRSTPAASQRDSIVAFDVETIKEVMHP